MVAFQHHAQEYESWAGADENEDAKNAKSPSEVVRLKQKITELEIEKNELEGELNIQLFSR